MSTATFRMAVVHDPAGPDSIDLINVPIPDPGPGQIRVRVAGSSVNPVDVTVASGFFHTAGMIHQPDRTGLGWDFAGIVEAAGSDVSLAPGTRVAGLVTGVDRNFGTYAEQLVVAADDVAVLPEGLDLIAAATIPLNGLTAVQMLDLLGKPENGDRLLVTGAAGAVGGYLAVLAPERGWKVTGLARATDERFLRDLGADFTVQASPGWDAVADAGALQETGLDLVRDGGRFVGVLPALPLTPERGIVIETVSVESDGAGLGDLLARTVTGALPVRVHTVLPLDQVAHAHRVMAKGGLRGRLVLTP